jgi:hypothetical protein
MSSVGNLIKATKEKDYEAFKKNWLYITQTVISLTVLSFCIGYILSGKATEQNDKIIVWSILSTIIGNYLPSARFQNKPNNSTVVTEQPEMPNLERSARNRHSSLESSYSYEYS